MNAFLLPCNALSHPAFLIVGPTQIISFVFTLWSVPVERFSFIGVQSVVEREISLAKYVFSVSDTDNEN